MAKSAQGLKGMVSKKKLVLPIESWVSLLFKNFFLLMVQHGSILLCDYYDLNANFLIFFSRNFTSSTVLEYWVKTLVSKNNSSSLIFTNIELRFEQCVFNLI